MGRNRFLGPIVVSVLLSPATVLAVGPMPHQQNPPLSLYPCDSASHLCNSCAADPNAVLQVQESQRSARSNDTPDLQFGVCNGNHMWCKFSPQLLTPTYSIIPGPPGGAGIRINVGYDFPNNYCLVWDVGDSCAASNWPTPPGTHLTRLQLLEGANTIYDIPAIFENGTWMPTILVSACDGTVHTYTIRITNSGGFGDCASPTFDSRQLVVTFPVNSDPICKPDLRPCPGCPDGGPQ